MLGIRLDARAEERLARFARESGRSKSDVAREAVRDYLARHDVDAEFQRQVALLGESRTKEDVPYRQAMTDEWLRMLDDEDGGYDWGEDGPPQ